MNYNHPAILLGNASEISARNGPGVFNGLVQDLAEQASSSSGLFVISCVEGELRKQANGQETPGDYAMQLSERAFSEKWDREEEDIWDAL